MRSRVELSTSEVYIDATAIVEPGAVIGPGTKIWHFTHVVAGAEIGSACTLGQNVFVAGTVRIGHHVKIQNNVSVYDGVTLEDYAFCGPSVVFTNVKTPRCAFPRSREEYGDTHVGIGASIGANATIVCGTSIGDWSLVGAGAVVTTDVPNHALVLGTPARQVGWACHCGERLQIRDLHGDESCINDLHAKEDVRPTSALQPRTGHSGFVCTSCGNCYVQTDMGLVLDETTKGSGQQ